MEKVCMLCNKSFSCGRSLGGHLRSHVMNSAQNSENQRQRKLRNFNNGGTDSDTDLLIDRFPENPRKISKFSDGNRCSLLQNKNCNKCGKSFDSCKALFGHMKIHAQKLSKEDLLVCSTQSNNEIEDSNHGKRSRTIRRYTATRPTANASVFSISNASKSVFPEIEKEQEEVALCLIMLSKDVGDFKNYSIDSEFFKGQSSIKNDPATEIELENSTKCKKHEFFDCRELEKERLYFDGKQSEFNDSEISRNECLKNKSEFVDDDLESKKDKNYDEKSKFECTTCSKRFNSYQALGGHKASHKRLKGCQIETESKITNSFTNDSQTGQKNKEFECPICFRVFSSGQALGGHKRSHVMGDAKRKQGILIKEHVHEVRDFIDLNLPAPTEDESNGDVGFRKWWIGSN